MLLCSSLNYNSVYFQPPEKCIICGLLLWQHQTWWSIADIAPGPRAGLLAGLTPSEVSRLLLSIVMEVPQHSAAVAVVLFLLCLWSLMETVAELMGGKKTMCVVLLVLLFVLWLPAPLDVQGGEQWGVGCSGFSFCLTLGWWTWCRHCQSVSRSVGRSGFPVELVLVLAVGGENNIYEFILTLGVYEFGNVHTIHR